MSLLDDRNLAYGNTELRYRIETALVSAAIDIQAEGTGVVNHFGRSALAYDILHNPVGFSQLMAIGFTEDASITNASTDTDIKNRASAIFNAYALIG